MFLGFEKLIPENAEESFFANPVCIGLRARGKGGREAGVAALGVSGLGSPCHAMPHAPWSLSASSGAARSAGRRRFGSPDLKRLSGVRIARPQRPYAGKQPSRGGRYITLVSEPEQQARANVFEKVMPARECTEPRRDHKERRGGGHGCTIFGLKKVLLLGKVKKYIRSKSPFALVKKKQNPQKSSTFPPPPPGKARARKTYIRAHLRDLTSPLTPPPRPQPRPQPPRGHHAVQPDMSLPLLLHHCALSHTMYSTPSPPAVGDHYVPRTPPTTRNAKRNATQRNARYLMVHGQCLLRGDVRDLLVPVGLQRQRLRPQQLLLQPLLQGPRLISREAAFKPVLNLCNQHQNQENQPKSKGRGCGRFSHYCVAVAAKTGNKNSPRKKDKQNRPREYHAETKTGTQCATELGVCNTEQALRQTKIEVLRWVDLGGLWLSPRPNSLPIRPT